MRRAFLCIALLASACEESYPPTHLSSWDLFEDGAAQIPRDDVVPYELISPLFSDYAGKHRFIRLPEGERITYTAEGDWVFPIGTLIVKTFAFAEDLRDPSAGEHVVETRLLALEEDGAWHAYVYLWDDETSDAVYRPQGATVDVSWIHTDGASRSLSYHVPNVAECATCHGGSDDVTPIGPRTVQIDRDLDYGAGAINQIDHFASLGWFDVEVPAARSHFDEPFGAADLDRRARAYLDANCAHCHRDGGAAEQSGLHLGADIEDPYRLGVCKIPIAAGRATGGRSHDIVPGSPDDSILVFRVESFESGIKMPPFGALVHEEGAALLREWIASMPPQTCE
jgi:uncharacterized repeat protein (TIGR03806 family)